MQNTKYRILLQPENAAVVIRSVASVCLYAHVYVCPVCAVTFESLDLETSFLVCRYINRISRSNLYVKVVGSNSESQEEKRDV